MPPTAWGTNKWMPLSGVEGAQLLNDSLFELAQGVQELQNETIYKYI